MKTTTRWLSAAVFIIGFSAGCALLDGPTDIEAEQDAALDAQGAQLMAQQAAECTVRFGPDAQVFVLEGQHTVCRPSTAFVPAVLTAQVQP